MLTPTLGCSVVRNKTGFEKESTASLKQTFLSVVSFEVSWQPPSLYDETLLKIK